MLPTLWSRWNTLAYGAARVQSNVILTILYFVVLLALALVRRLFRNLLSADAAWHEPPPATHDLASVRQQF